MTNVPNYAAMAASVGYAPWLRRVYAEKAASFGQRLSPDEERKIRKENTKYWHKDEQVRSHYPEFDETGEF